MCSNGATCLPVDCCFSELKDPVKYVDLDQIGLHHHFIEYDLFSTWKIPHLLFNNKHSLTHYILVSINTILNQLLTGLFTVVPSSSDISDNEDYPYSPNPPPFKPWTGSCTSINGTQKHYLTRTDRWEQLLENAGFGFHSLRKPVGPPLHFHDNEHQTNSDLTKPRKHLNPWLINYNSNNEHDQPNKSLTAYTTKVQKYPSN